jgi:hypothetical protein
MITSGKASPTRGDVLLGNVAREAEERVKILRRGMGEVRGDKGVENVEGGEGD